MTAALVAEGVALVLLAAIVLHLLRVQARVLALLHHFGLDGGARHGPTAARREAVSRPVRRPMAGGPAPPVRGETPDGRAATVEAGVGTTVLCFVTSSCATCRWLWDRLGEQPPEGHADARLRVVAVTPGAALESRKRVAELAPPGVEVVMSADAWADYGVTGSPFAVVSTDGIVRREGPMSRPEDWADLLR